LHEAIRNAMATVRTGHSAPCELVEEFDPSLPPVAADQGALEQVLINLIANACDASAGMDNPRVSVRTRFVSGLVFNTIRLGKATRLPIEITVTDGGAGIDPALRDHVFEPFVSSKPHGQGLGLALVRKLLRDMGGRISHVRDERAGETHFRINLPVAG
jgi:two-component system nitrogen regulation sensor histidine kinase GlnL